MPKANKQSVIRRLNIKNSGDDEQSVQVVPSRWTYCFQGGVGSLQIFAPPKCQWNIAVQEEWIILNSPPTGSGMGEINYNVLPNFDNSREGKINVDVNTPKKLTFTHEIIQFEGIRTETISEHFLESPEILEFVILIMFLADLIKKVPYPPRAALIAAAVAAINVASGIALAFFFACDQLIPYYTIPDQYQQFLEKTLDLNPEKIFGNMDYYHDKYIEITSAEIAEQSLMLQALLLREAAG